MLPKVSVDVEEAKRVWAEYERTHDLSGHDRHEAVGIDPTTGEVFFGASSTEIGLKLKREGRHRPLFFRRVGSPIYDRKPRKRVGPIRLITPPTIEADPAIVVERRS